MLRQTRLFAITLLGCCLAARAQTTFASITGMVTDPSGAIMPRVTVTAINVETGIKSSAESNGSGNYTIGQLKEGAYRVEAGAPGFQPFSAVDVVLAARDIRRVDVTLQLTGVQATVQVNGGATLIETETARISDTRTAAVIKTLPSNTRGAQAFLVLSPAVQRQPGSYNYMFSGSRDNQENATIDGTSIADLASAQPTSPFFNYSESFEEVKVDTANNSAEFGPVGNITFITKSGTNQFHGSLFDYYSTPWFRARNPFASTRSIGLTHLPGGSAGGPVYVPHLYDGRNKTFFFFSVETARGSSTNQLLNPTVPLQAWRSGDFSGLGIAIKDPATGQPFPNMTVPASRINPVSQKIQDRFYPLPNYGDVNVFHSQNYREMKVRAYDPSTYRVARIDQHFSDRDSLFGRASFYTGYNRPWQYNLPTIGQQQNTRIDQSATVSETHVFRSNLVNEVRWGFMLNNNPVIGPQNGPAIVKDLGLVGLSPDLPNLSGLLQVSWSGLGLQSINQANYSDPGFRNHSEELQEHLSWFRGRHSLKFGLELLRAEWDDYHAANGLYGSVTFSNRYTGYPYADFLLGIPSSAGRAFAPLAINRNHWRYELFAADDFKVSQNLTINLGVRYEVHLPWRELGGRQSNFDIRAGKIVVPDGSLSRISPIFPQNYVRFEQAKDAGLPSGTLIHPDLNNFSPRIGIAYRPFGPKTVFRAGYGIFYDVVPATPSQGDSPFILAEPRYTNPATNPTVIFPRVFPSTGNGGPSTVSLPMAINPNLRTPYSMQYNATVEHQAGATGFRVSFVGTNTRKGYWAYNYNSPVPDTRLFIDKARPFPNYPEIYYFTNGAGHQYEGLTFEVKRQLASGLYFQSSWVLARDRYDADSNGDMDFSELISENPFDRHREVGTFRAVPTHRFITNWVYQLPFGKGRHYLSGASRLLNLVVGGWEVSGIYTAGTGEFLTPFWTGPDPVGIAYTDSSTPAEVTIRPDQLHDPNLPASQRSLANWFDLSAFAPPKAGQFGSASRGAIRGPGLNVWDMGIFKTIPFGERIRLRYQATGFNIFNHPNWGNPNSTDITDTGSVGVISSVGPNAGFYGSGARAFQMALRLEW